LTVRLFVGNLPYQSSEAELREYFSPVAPPSQVVMPVDRETGRPRGFAFVDFSDRPVAEEVIRRFAGQPFKGRPLAISEARGREERGPGSRPMGGPPPRPTGFAPAEGGGAAPGPRPARTFGPDAPPKRVRAAKRHKGEQKPRGPIKERPISRLFDVGDEEDEASVEFDDPATRAGEEQLDEEES
jgi:RNA recognition motif-containing protein